VIVVVTLSGGVNPTMPVSYMTHASALALVPFPQLSPPIRSYLPILPSPCALGQQVTALLSRALLFAPSYCSGTLLFNVASSYAIV